MGYIIGTDEAGYGPNLGPLVISATVWQAPDGTKGEDLFELLKDVVAATLPKKSRGKDELPVFADSKILYSPNKGWRNLERGLWAAWELLGWEPLTWRKVWEKLAPSSCEVLASCPFYRNFDRKLPRDWKNDRAFCSPLKLVDGVGANAISPLPAGEGPEVRAEWHSNFAKTGVQLLTVRSRAVFPAEFNLLMDRHDSKGAALSHLTLGLVADLIRPLKKGPISVLCDKHGGRDRYAALLNEHFSDGFVEVCSEGRQASIYRFGPPERRVEFQFRAKAENCLPAALASMASKYLRELAMEAFNAFWTIHLPALQPTAGYPQDALRFRAEIATKQRELEIDDAILWRKK